MDALEGPSPSILTQDPELQFALKETAKVTVVSDPT
jgi:hypothetical protein